MAVTMSDVARAAGVSVMTVSNVLNDRPRVSEATRARVLAVVDDLGYQVNLTARRLRAGRTDTIALVVPTFAHRYYSELADLLADELDSLGRHLVVTQSGASRAGELSALSRARLALYDGVVLSSVGLSTTDLAALPTDQRLVLLGERSMPARLDHVSMDNVGGAALATRHLLDGGARRVLVAGGEPTPGDGVARLRTTGWRLALGERGLVPEDSLLLPAARYGSREARAAVGAAIADGVSFDAVLAITDEIALGVLAALEQAGLRVPHDVQVVGFDALEVSEFVGLSTIDPGNDWIAREAARLVVRRVEDPLAPTAHIVSSSRLVVRSSTRARAR